MTFPAQALTGRRQQRASNVKPESRTPNSEKALQKATRDTAIGPPKKRRQLSAKPAQTGNPFGALNSLVGKALKG